MAYRMQTSGPELIDFGKETKETLEMYGAEPGKASYANNCLLARRLVERGVRFVQLYHTDWDHHADLGQPLDQVTREIDQPTAALIRDLKQRGLLENTLVVWGGEFGRTPMGEVRESGKAGRNHHIDAYTLWMAGGGVKPGHDRRRHRRSRLLAHRRPHGCARSARHHAAPAGTRSHQADVQVPGPRFPADRRRRSSHPQTPGLI